MKVIKQIKEEGILVGYFLREMYVWKYYFIMMLLIVLSIITNLGFSYSFSTILSGDWKNVDKWPFILLTFVCGRLACTLCRFLYSQLSLKFKMSLKEKYMSRISEKFLKADYSWIVKQRGGDLIGRSSEDVNWCAEAVAVYVPKLIKSVGLLSFNVVLLSLFHPLLGAAFLLPIPVLFFSEWRGRQICQRYLKESMAVMSERNAVFEDIVSHHELVAHSAAQEEMLGRTEEVILRYARMFARSMGALVGWMSPAILLNKVPLVLIGILGSLFINQGKISVSAFLTAFLFTYLFNAELAELDDFMANFPTLAVYMERVKEMMECPQQQFGVCDTFSKSETMIKFANVSFRYTDSPEDKLLFEALSFDIRRGEHILLLGKNGCGKTTVLKLICGIYASLEAGCITLCGYRPQHYTFSCLYRMISYVPSEPVLWEGTLRDNLTCGTMLKDKNILDTIRAFDFLAAFQGKTEKEILELDVKDRGSNLSGGQRQRIGLARGWLSGAPVLLLDEATNSLDYQGEERIIKFLCTSNRTICMTTHHTELSGLFDKGIDIENGKELLWKEKCHDGL